MTTLLQRDEAGMRAHLLSDEDISLICDVFHDVINRDAIPPIPMSRLVIIHRDFVQFRKKAGTV